MRPNASWNVWGTPGTASHCPGATGGSPLKQAMSCRATKLPQSHTVCPGAGGKEVLAEVEGRVFFHKGCHIQVCSSGAVCAAAQHGGGVFLFDVCRRIVTNFCVVCAGDCIIAFASCCCCKHSTPAPGECFLDGGTSRGFSFS